MSTESRLVFSTDKAANAKCPKCKQLVSECLCRKDEEVSSKSFTAVLRIEKAGRGGKTVTIIDKLPKSESFLKALLKELKEKCGSGGAYSLDGKLEIQGDKRELISAILAKKSIKTKL